MLFLPRLIPPYALVDINMYSYRIGEIGEFICLFYVISLSLVGLNREGQYEQVVLGDENVILCRRNNVPQLLNVFN